MEPQKLALPGGDDVLLTSMTLESYPLVREIVPKVSRCQITHPPEVVRTMIDDPNYYPICAFKGSDLVGYAELHLCPHIGRMPDGRLERVVVAESFRGKGLATALCREIISLAKKLKCGRMDLTVEKDEARHIYEDKLDFLKVDTTVMRLMLD